jgi:3-oxoacyl-[acyl-carrier protein] reductase
MTLTKPQQIALTGGSTGIGRAAAIKLADTGVRIALLGRRLSQLAETAKAAASQGAEVTIIPLDLTKPESIAKCLDELISCLPEVDCLVNSAGVWHDNQRALQGPLLHEVAQTEIEEILTTGVTGTVHLTSGIVKSMATRGRGTIVNISGTFENGAKGWLPYYLSKKAIEAFTIGLSQEALEYGVRVNALSPADVATPAYEKFYPENAKDALSPDEVADMIALLTSSATQHISGQIIEIRRRQS